MRLHWNPHKQIFQDKPWRSLRLTASNKAPRPKRGRGKGYTAEKNLDYKGKRSQLNIRIDEAKAHALRSACANSSLSLNDYMSRVIEAHLQAITPKPQEAYDYSDPDLTTYLEGLNHAL
jgi:uncharacterized protein (DUF1778 family)|tara:strand:+ start:136 stop:492 length:357 start_codon:yes stop_codon:yes gene_type:complete